MRAGFDPAETRGWSVPKLNWMAGLLQKQKCNDALLLTLAGSDPKRLIALRDENDDDESEPEWEPPSLERIKRRMKHAGTKS